MKRLLLASTALVVLGGSAIAADLPARMPVKATIAAPALFSWTACSIGGHVGGGWSHTSISDPNTPAALPVITNSPAATIDLSSQSVVGGVQVGCDYQFASNWVIGAAGDFSWANIDGDTIDPFFNGKAGNPITLNSKTNYLASMTGRVGYAWERYLLYAKGGAAWAHNKYSIGNLAFFNNQTCIGGGCTATASETRLGWTLGGGLEWAFASNWSAFAEFDYYDFGTKSVTFTGSNPLGSFGSQPFDIKQHNEVVKVGVNYRFNGLIH